MVRWIKPLIGCMAIVLAVAGMIYWEKEGRDYFMTEEVAAAAEDIAEGVVVDASMFRPIRVPRENLIEGALTMEEAGNLSGLVSDKMIEANQQITEKCFDTKGSRIEKGKSIFVIRPSWIDMRSSSLRAGDLIHIYSDNGDRYFGVYRLAFAKDDNEQEVVAADGLASPKNILDRKMSSRAVNHVEIIASLEEYEAIMAFVLTEGRSLMLVQKGEF